MNPNIYRARNAMPDEEAAAQRDAILAEAGTGFVRPHWIGRGVCRATLLHERASFAAHVESLAEPPVHRHMPNIREMYPEIPDEISIRVVSVLVYSPGGWLELHTDVVYGGGGWTATIVLGDFTGGEAVFGAGAPPDTHLPSSYVLARVPAKHNEMFFYAAGERLHGVDPVLTGNRVSVLVSVVPWQHRMPFPKGAERIRTAGAS